jgi:hypothetical protein
MAVLARVILLTGFAACSLPTPTLAQSPDGVGPLPTEKVIVTAPKEVPSTTLHDFIEAYGAPSEPVGNIARWRVGICPAIAGLPADYEKLVVARIHEIALRVGAPVADDGCRFNIDVVFSPRPQAVMDDVRLHHEVLLGFHDTVTATQVATVRHPVQAWYTTETEDTNGQRSIDSKQRNQGVTLFVPPSPNYRTGLTVFLPSAREERVNSTLLGDHLRSQLFHVIVTVDLNKIAGLKIGALADQIAVLALATSRASEDCLEPPSITNQTLAACPAERRPDGATPFDLAYLSAVYHVDSSLSLSEQQSAIQYQMQKTLGGGG